MMTIKIIRLVHLMSYILVASQLIFYLAVFTHALKGVSIESFIEHRKGVEPFIALRLKIIYYTCLALSALLVFFALKQGDKVLIVSSTIAFLCLAADVFMALKGSVPVNNIINANSIGDSTMNWQEIRDQWLSYITYRGVIIGVGTFTLIGGLLFGKKM